VRRSKEGVPAWRLSMLPERLQCLMQRLILCGWLVRSFALKKERQAATSVNNGISFRVKISPLSQRHLGSTFQLSASVRRIHCGPSLTLEKWLFGLIHLGNPICPNTKLMSS